MEPVGIAFAAIKKDEERKKENEIKENGNFFSSTNFIFQAQIEFFMSPAQIKNFICSTKI